jgi:ribonuclease R
MTPSTGAPLKRPRHLEMQNVISYDDLVKLGRHISFTERRADDAERELRQVKILALMAQHIGDIFAGVVTGITNFGIFVQIREYLIDGLIRYEDLMDDWWDVDERSGVVRGQRTGAKIGIGDVIKVIVVSVDQPRRELKLAISEHLGRPVGLPQPRHSKSVKKGNAKNKDKKPKHRGAAVRFKSKPRSRR